MKHFFLRFVFAALLLVAQQAAVTHAIWHAHGPNPEQQEDSSKRSFQAGSCEWHGAFCQVLGGAPAAYVSHAAQHGAAEQAAPPALTRLTALSPTPLSRGPPALL